MGYTKPSSLICTFPCPISFASLSVNPAAPLRGDNIPHRSEIKLQVIQKTRPYEFNNGKLDRLWSLLRSVSLKHRTEKDFSNHLVWSLGHMAVPLGAPQGAGSSKVAPMSKRCPCHGWEVNSKAELLGGVVLWSAGTMRGAGLKTRQMG